MKLAWHLYLGVLAFAVGSACGGSVTSDGSGGDGGTAGTVTGAGGTLGGNGGEGGPGGTSGFGGDGGIGPGGTSGFGGAGFGGGGVGGDGGVGGAPVPRRLGRACASDAECGDGLFCATADSGELMDGAGPARGLCTAECTNDGTVCWQFDPDAICYVVPPETQPIRAFCFESCSFGPQGLMAFDPNKCHGRQEVACSPLAISGRPTCLPQCNSDQDCPSGRFCNPTTGLCHDVAVTGDPVGSKCDPGADTCRGECISFPFMNGGSTQMCFERCVTGALPACGWNGPGTGPADAFCVYAYTEVLNGGGPGLGDIGSCGQLCNCNSDCRNPDVQCEPINNAQFSQSVGKLGICQEPNGTSPGLPCAVDAGVSD